MKLFSFGLKQIILSVKQHCFYLESLGFNESIFHFIPIPTCVTILKYIINETGFNPLQGSVAYMQHIIFDLVIISGLTYQPFMHIYSNIQTFFSAPTLFELFIFHFCMCDSEGYLSYSRHRETQRVRTFFVMILYRVMSLYGIHFSYLLNSIHGLLHLYYKFYSKPFSH